MYLVLLGSPGTGKGTQGASLAERFGWTHFSTGDMLREAVAAGNELGRAAKKYMDRGALVPDDLVIEMIVKRLRERDVDVGFILDGFPRNLAQAKALDEALASIDKSIDLTLNFTAPDDELVRRLSGRWVCPNCGKIYHVVHDPPLEVGECDRCNYMLVQRDDDKPETVRARIEHQRPPKDLLAHYRGSGKLVEINADQPVSTVTADVLEAVEAASRRPSEERLRR